MYECVDCGRPIGIDGINGVYCDAAGGICCERCAEKYLTECSVCGLVEPKGSMQILGVYNQIGLCDNCLEKLVKLLKDK